jgi:hypothetical protein
MARSESSVFYVLLRKMHAHDSHRIARTPGVPGAKLQTNAYDLDSAHLVDTFAAQGEHAQELLL